MHLPVFLCAAYSRFTVAVNGWVDMVVNCSSSWFFYGVGAVHRVCYILPQR